MATRTRAPAAQSSRAQLSDTAKVSGESSAQNRTRWQVSINREAGHLKSANLKNQRRSEVNSLGCIAVLGQSAHLADPRAHIRRRAQPATPAYQGAPWLLRVLLQYQLGTQYSTE